MVSNKSEKLFDFLQKITTSGEITKIIGDRLDKDLLSIMSTYSQSASKIIESKVISDAEIALTLLIIGYLLRTEEQRIELSDILNNSGD